MRRAALRALPLLIASLPSVALACPVCFSANEQNRLAFLGTTVFMTVLPLTMIGGVVYWLREKYRDEAPGETD